jgi:hypothetical protein
MNSKLTLTIDDHIIKKAKVFARERKSSLSDMIEQFLKILIKDSEIPEISDQVKSMKGSFKMTVDNDYREVFIQELTKKYIGRAKSSA